MKIEIDTKVDRGETVYLSKTLETGIVEEISISGYPQGFLCWYKVRLSDGTSTTLHSGDILTKEEYKGELQRRLEDVK